MPVVSASVTLCMPMPRYSPAAHITRSGGRSPSNGHPKAVAIEPFTRNPVPFTRSITRRNCARDCSHVMRMLARLWRSPIDITRLISSTLHAMARSHPRSLGTSAT
jgi:hypothetical protein